MRYSQEEIQHLDKEAYQAIVQEKNLNRFMMMFPDVRDMVDFSNAEAKYPYRRNSVLALLVQSGNSALLEDFWDRYFFLENREKRALQKEFLKGTNLIGQKMNFHYFAAETPPKVRAEQEIFCGGEDDKEYWEFQLNNRLLPKDTRTPAEKERWKMYEFLREKAYVLEHYEQDMEPEKKVVFERGDKLEEHISGKENTFIWQKERQILSDVILRKHDSKVRAEDGSWVRIEGLDAASEKSFAAQAFKKMDYPDSFFWAKDGLDSLEYMVKRSSECLDDRELSKYFELQGGIVLIEESEENMTSNLLEGKSSIAHCGINAANRPVFGIYGENFIDDAEEKKNATLPHEMTHASDMVAAENVQPFEDTDIMKLAFMCLYENKPNTPKRCETRKIIDEVIWNYKCGAYRREVLARIMEPRSYDKNEPLLENLRRLYRAYYQAKKQNKTGITKHIETMAMRQMKNYAEVKLLCDKFDDFVPVAAAYDRDEFKKGISANYNITADAGEYYDKFNDFYPAYLDVFGCQGPEKRLNKMIEKELKEISKMQEGTQNISRLKRVLLRTR